MAVGPHQIGGTRRRAIDVGDMATQIANNRFRLGFHKRFGLRRNGEQPARHRAVGNGVPHRIRRILFGEIDQREINAEKIDQVPGRVALARQQKHALGRPAL